MEQKRKYNFGSTYKPQSMDKDAIDRGLKKAFSSIKKSEGIKPLNISGQQRKPEPSQTFFEKPKEEEKPYWTAQQWEEWAYKLYKSYAEVHEYLPDWFLEAMEEE